MSNITKEEVLSVAKIARLKLTDEEIKKYTKDLNSILDSFKILNEVNTDGLKETFHPLEELNVFRDDEIESSIKQDEALKNSKNKSNGFFKGPIAIEE